MRVRYTLRARDDLDAIYIYLDQRSPAGAQSVKHAIERRIGQLGDPPFIAPVTDEPGVRELAIVRYPYKVYYRIDMEEIQIVHVRHSARRRPETTEL